MIISADKSIIPACDVGVEEFATLVQATADLAGIGAYKLGFTLGLSVGLPRAVELARKYTTKPLIYDHQKAGTDIPDTGKVFARVCKQAGIDAVILFPQAGPATEQAWIEAARAEGLGVIVGGLMTHKSYTRRDGGWIADEAIFEIYRLAASCGVTDFVVPGTKPDDIATIRKMLVAEGMSPIFYAPGLVTQGGNIAQVMRTAGGRCHPIIGRAICDAGDQRQAAVELIAALDAST